MKKRYYFFFFLPFTSSTLLAQSGIPDNLFAGGKITTAVSTDDEFGNAVAIQPDKRIVVAGTVSYNGSYADFGLVRYNSNGTLDLHFGNNGKVISSVGESDDLANAMVIQPDRKIIVAGTSYVGLHFNFSLVRFTSKGKLDKHFNETGKVITPMSNFDNKINALAVQPDGKIIAAGSSSNGVTDEFALARYHSDGSLDQTFGSGGEVLLSIGSNSLATGVLLQPDGKIVVTGTANDDVNTEFAIARFNTNGNIDASFGRGGMVLTSFGSGNDEASSSVLQPNGKIILAGSAQLNNHDYFAVSRYETNGSLDPTFGNAGVVLTEVENNSSNARSVALGSDGSILVAGNISSGNNQQHPVVIRMDAYGNPDKSFGIEGLANTSFGALDDGVTSMALQPDGKIVIAGYSNNGANYDVAIARLGAEPMPAEKTAIASSAVKIFPNPTIHQVEFSFPVQESTATWSIYNAGGEQIFPSHYSITGNNILLDVSDFPAGVYQVLIVQGQQKQSGSFTKQ